MKEEELKKERNIHFLYYGLGMLMFLLIIIALVLANKDIDFYEESFSKWILESQQLGDLYFGFDSTEFNFCDVCNEKLLRQMVEHFEVEKELTKKVTEEEKK